MSIKIFNILEKEMKENELQIKKLEARNRQINSLFDTANQLMGKPTVVKSNSMKGVLRQGSRKDLIMRTLSDGKTWNVRNLTSTVLDAVNPPQDQIDAVANTCSALFKQGKVKRIQRGVYRLKWAKKNAEKEQVADVNSTPEHIEPPKQLSVSIGSDTRVTQIPNNNISN